MAGWSIIASTGVPLFCRPLDPAPNSLNLPRGQQRRCGEIACGTATGNMSQEPCFASVRVAGEGKLQGVIVLIVGVVHVQLVPREVCYR